MNWSSGTQIWSVQASGIDTSARMISLAINSALMGLILVEGVLFVLKRSLAQRMPDTDLRMRKPDREHNRFPL